MSHRINRQITIALLALCGFAPLMGAEKTPLLDQIEARIKEADFEGAKTLVTGNRHAATEGFNRLIAQVEEKLKACSVDPATGALAVDGATMGKLMTAEFIGEMLSEASRDESLLTRIHEIRSKFKLPDMFVTGEMGAPPPSISHPAVGEWTSTGSPDSPAQLVLALNGDGTFTYMSLVASMPPTMSNCDGMFEIKESRIRFHGVREGGVAMVLATEGSGKQQGETRKEGGGGLPDREVAFSLGDGNNTLSMEDPFASGDARPKRVFKRGEAATQALTPVPTKAP